MSHILPPHIRRFLLTSIPSVPHLEALLLLRNEADAAWSGARLAERLYVGESQARVLLEQLAASRIIERTSEGADDFRYQPRSGELAQLIDELAILYSKNLLEVTHLIHSKTDRMAQQFADAFKWKKDS